MHTRKRTPGTVKLTAATGDTLDRDVGVGLDISRGWSPLREKHICIYVELYRNKTVDASQDTPSSACVLLIKLLSFDLTFASKDTQLV